jgi:hypothetical protein
MIPVYKMLSKMKKDHPPKKKITIIDDIIIIFPYSPKKNIANNIPEYSKLYPATISASASGKSKGALFVSAKIAIKSIKLKGKKGTIFQTDPTCAKIISVKFKLPEIIIIGKIHKLIIIS